MENHLIFYLSVVGLSLLGGEILGHGAGASTSEEELSSSDAPTSRTTIQVINDDFCDCQATGTGIGIGIGDGKWEWK